jgi:hypothetical protein
MGESVRNMASEWSEFEFGLSIEASPAARAIVALPLQPPPGSQPNGFPTASGSSSMSLSSTLIRQRPSPARLVASTSSAICPGASGRRSFHPTCQRKAPKLDPYGVLDLPRKATKKEIKERFYEVRPTLHSISREKGLWGPLELPFGSNSASDSSSTPSDSFASSRKCTTPICDRTTTRPRKSTSRSPRRTTRLATRQNGAFRSREGGDDFLSFTCLPPWSSVGLTPLTDLASPALPRSI